MDPPRCRDTHGEVGPPACRLTDRFGDPPGVRRNARIEHDQALKRVMTAMLNDDMQLFKQFTDNEGSRRWLTDSVFGLTYASLQAEKRAR